MHYIVPAEPLIRPRTIGYTRIYIHVPNSFCGCKFNGKSKTAFRYKFWHIDYGQCIRILYIRMSHVYRLFPEKVWLPEARLCEAQPVKDSKYITCTVHCRMFVSTLEQWARRWLSSHVGCISCRHIVRAKCTYYNYYWLPCAPGPEVPPNREPVEWN